MRLLCMKSPLNGEYTLCGLEFEAAAVGTGTDDPEFAQSGEAVTCPNCRHVIRECHAVNGRWQVPA